MARRSVTRSRVSRRAGIGDATICGRPIDTLGKLMGGFWSDIAKTSHRRQAVCSRSGTHAAPAATAGGRAERLGLRQRASSGTFAAWEAAYCGTNQNTIKTAQQQAASFNTAGDSGPFTPGTSADSKGARAIADYVFWNLLP